MHGIQSFSAGAPALRRGAILSLLALSVLYLAGIDSRFLFAGVRHDDHPIRYLRSKGLAQWLAYFVGPQVFYSAMSAVTPSNPWQGFASWHSMTYDLICGTVWLPACVSPANTFAIIGVYNPA